MENKYLKMHKDNHYSQGNAVGLEHLFCDDSKQLDLITGLCDGSE